MSTSLLKEGRCLHQEYQGEDDDEKELYAKKVVAMDPFEPRLKPISADKCILITNQKILILILVGYCANMETLAICSTNTSQTLSMIPL